jgi:hypothetical protein
VYIGCRRDPLDNPKASSTPPRMSRFTFSAVALGIFSCNDELIPLKKSIDKAE